MGVQVRIALVHSFYSSSQPSGENAVVRAEVDALRSRGVDVHLVHTSTDERISETAYIWRTALRVASGHGESPLAALEALSPDLVHIHNLFPNWGDAWLRDSAWPLVHTLHNYRPLCAAGTLYRGGAVCTLCSRGQTTHALRYRCYRNSLTATAPLALHNLGGVPRNPLLTAADRIVVLGERMRELYRQAGIPSSRLVVWPNFLPSHLVPAPIRAPRSGGNYLVVGRMTSEKGIDLLVRKWPAAGPTLDVVGDGPLLDEVIRLATLRTNVRIHGRLEREAVLQLMISASALVVPSRWFEGFPLLYAEALASGLPVLTFEPCNLVEFVQSDGVGDILTWNEPLDAQLPTSARLFEWRQRCRDVFESRYTETAYGDRAISLYQSMLNL
jgi:glycosyltransferase involved in cell wall biosynthesis